MRALPVTGGSRGIGAEIAKRLAQDGANVAITYPGSISTLFAAPVAASKGGELQATVFLFCSVLHAALRRVTSEPHLGQCRGRVDVC